MSFLSCTADIILVIALLWFGSVFSLGFLCCKLGPQCGDVEGWCGVYKRWGGV